MSEFQSISLALFLSAAWVAWSAHVAFRLHKNRQPDVLAAGKDIEHVIAFASQTGTAELLAHALAANNSLTKGASVIPLEQISTEQLVTVKHVTYVVSTYGDGEPPDNGRKFYRQLQTAVSNGLKLSSLKFSVTALGDKTYPDYCAFGLAIREAMLALGAQEKSPLQMHDRLSAEDIQSQYDAKTSLATQGQECQLTLMKREKLNSGQSDGLFELQFKVDTKNVSWRAGDLVDFKLPAEFKDSYARTYSIASIPEEGVLKLIVRQHRKENGEFGVCSNWLTFTLTEGGSVYGFIRENHVCHLDNIDAPLLMVGTGSGLAGIRSQILHRKQKGLHGPIWLIYGERFPNLDEPLKEEMDAWEKEGTVKVLNKVFSRCPQQPLYVQDVLVREQAAILQFLSSNGHIYVCGRHHPMGVEVDHVLRSILGEETYERMIEQHRYHRDTY